MKKKGDRMVPNCVPESKELLDMQEADLTKRQVKMVHKAADKLDKKDFMKRYGKDGDSVRYATATNMVKKKLGIDEQRALSSPEVAATLRQFIAQRPFIDNKKDYEELMRLAAKDMGMFNARLNRMNDQTKEKVKSALQRKGLTSHLTNEKEPKGDKPMQEQSYKDKFNATMKDFGIKSLGDLKSDEEKKKFFKAVDAKHDAKDEMKKMNAMKHNMKSEAMNTAMDGGTSMPDMNLKAMKKMNAMKMSEPMKKMDDKETENPKKDADMSKVKDKQVMLKAMMKKEQEVPAEPMGKLKTGEKMKNEEAEPLTRPTMSLKDKMKINAMKMPIKSMKHMNAGYHEGMHEMMKKEMMKEMKHEMMKEMGHMPEMMKKEMMKEMKHSMEMKMKSEMSHGKMEMMKAERDPAKAEMMKQEMMKEMMKEMKHEMMKKMKEMMKEYGSMNAMKKPMNAMMKKEESNKYLDTKVGSIQDIARQMFEKEHQLVEVKHNDIEKMITDYLKKGGTITKLPPALAKGMKPSDMQKYKVGDKGVIKSMKMKEVRDFVDTYNKHFLTNWAAEELIEKKNLDEARYEVSHDYGSRFGSYGVTLTAVVDATSPQDAMKKGHDKLEKLSMSAKAEKLGVDELQDPDDEGKPSVKMTSKPVSFTDMKKF
jgi:hypothetical protein